MALVNTLGLCPTKLEVTIFILVGCLGYSNSAMNPILYAFLSDNFKKSFMKAFTCAKTKEVNAQLHAENSFFPRFGRSRNSECLSTKPTAKLISSVNNSNNFAAKVTATTTTVQSIKFGVDSIVNECNDINGTSNGHNNGSQQTNGLFLSNNTGTVTEEESDDEEQELECKQPDNSICIINAARPPVLHTDL